MSIPPIKLTHTIFQLFLAQQATVRFPGIRTRESGLIDDI